MAAGYRSVSWIQLERCVLPSKSGIHGAAIGGTSGTSGTPGRDNPLDERADQPRQPITLIGVPMGIRIGNPLLVTTYLLLYRCSIRSTTTRAFLWQGIWAEHDLFLCVPAVPGPDDLRPARAPDRPIGVRR